MLEAIAQAAGCPRAKSGARRCGRQAGERGTRRADRRRRRSAGVFAALVSTLLPMLAQPAQDVEDALRQLGTAALEWKLDGARVQIHKSDDEVRVYSRGLNDITLAVPRSSRRCACCHPTR